MGRKASCHQRFQHTLPWHAQMTASLSNGGLGSPELFTASTRVFTSSPSLWDSPGMGHLECLFLKKKIPVHCAKGKCELSHPTCRVTVPFRVFNSKKNIDKKVVCLPSYSTYTMRLDCFDCEVVCTHQWVHFLDIVLELSRITAFYITSQWNHTFVRVSTRVRDCSPSSWSRGRSQHTHIWHGRKYWHWRFKCSDIIQQKTLSAEIVNFEKK